MFVPSKFCVSIASSFSWDLQWSQEKTRTMLMQNLGSQTKSIMVFSGMANWLPKWVRWSNTVYTGLPVLFCSKLLKRVVFFHKIFCDSKDFLWFLCQDGTKKTRKFKASMKMKTKRTKMLTSFKNTFCNKNRQTQK